ncbi:MAG: ribosomal protein S18-alanine N-acetyltransferase [Clostridia bacterium]|nr:ribosomal protein S18-alanine N-acetyltransferase [Clostridia bacterium]
MQKSNIIKMEKRHIPQVAMLEKECFSSPWSEKMLEETYDNPCSYLIVWEEGDRVAGYVGLYKILDEGYITNVAVLPCFRRRGIAKALVEKLVAENRDLSFLTLEVRASNAGAIALYEKLGFEQVGVRPKYYSNPEEDAYLMTKEIEK